MKDTLKYYLSDTLQLLIESQQQAAKEARVKIQDNDNDAVWTDGRAYGQFEAISLLVSQLKSFEIPFEEVGLPPDFDPVSELLSSGS